MRYLGKLNETCLISCQMHFILLSGIFHSLPCIHFISISYLAPGYFITSQADFSFFISLLAPGYFIITQIFHYSFHYLPWAISQPPRQIFYHSFHYLHQAISYNPGRFFITCPGLFHNHPGRFFSIHFIICLGYFITTQADFHIHFITYPRLFHIHFITCSKLFHIHFVACPGLFHILAWAISYHCPLGPTLVLTVSHGLLTVFKVQKHTSKYGNMCFSK